MRPAPFPPRYDKEDLDGAMRVAASAHELVEPVRGAGGPRVALMASPKHLLTVVLGVRSPREGPVSYTLLPWVVPARVAGKGRFRAPKGRLAHSRQWVFRVSPPAGAALNRLNPA